MRSKNRRSVPYMQITPMVDVFLVLLIIFMIAPLYVTGVNVNLPSGSNQADRDNMQQHYIRISYNDDNLMLNDKKIELQDLVKEISLMPHNHFNNEIFLSGDKLSAYGNIMKIIDMLNVAGYKRIILITQKDGDSANQEH